MIDFASSSDIGSKRLNVFPSLSITSSNSSWPNPYAMISVHRLIYDHVFQGFRMLCNMEYLIDVPFEVSVILACHIQLFDHMLHLVTEEVLVINISEAEFNI